MTDEALGHAATNAAWRDRNRPHLRAYQAAYRASHPKRWLYERYGLTSEDFEALWAAQEGKCAICRSPLKRGLRGAHVDHNHTTQVVRGLLCRDCNLGIGYLKDEVMLIAAALVYLQAHD